METDKTKSPQIPENQNFEGMAKTERISTRLKTASQLSAAERVDALRLFTAKDPRLLDFVDFRLDETEFAEAVRKVLKKANNITDATTISTYQNILAKISNPNTACFSLSNAKSSLKYTKRCVENAIQNKPKSRSLNTQNFSNKKFITNSPVILNLFESLGFEHFRERKLILLSEESARKLSSTDIIASLDKTLHKLDSLKDITNTIQCNGKCGFYGQKDLDGYCEKCKSRKTPKSAADSHRFFCSKNCGFFGSKENHGLCSSCFKKQGRKSTKTAKKSPIQKCRSAMFRLGLVHWWYGIISTEQVNKSRCWKCNKKIGFLPIRCDCKYYFCAQHASTLEHNCHVNYKKKFEKRLRKENPLIESKKVDKV